MAPQYRSRINFTPANFNIHGDAIIRINLNRA